MIVALLATYFFALWLIFKKLHLVEATLKAKIVVAVVGAILIIGLLFVTNYWQPYSTEVRVSQYTVPIVPRVTGRVIEVPIDPNVPVKKGDVLFRLDPEPFEIDVRRLEAQLEVTKSTFRQNEQALQAATARVKGIREQADVLKAKIEGAGANVDASKAALATGVDEQRVAAANAKAAKAASEVQQRQYDRLKDLVEKKVESASRLDTLLRSLEASRAAYDSALARADEAQDRVDMLKAQVLSVQAVETQVRETRDTLQAQLDEAEALERKAKLALTPLIDGVHASIRTVEEQLATARWKLEQTVVRAPADGHVSQLQLKPGVVASILPAMATMVFVYEEKFVVATFLQNGMRHISLDDPVEITLDAAPGKVVTGRVVEISPTSGQGQATPTGALRTWAAGTPADRAALKIAFDGEAPGMNVPAGGGGAVAIYPGKFTGTKIIRRVIINMRSWTNFIFNG